MKKVTEYEVEWCWTNNEERKSMGQELSICRACGTILERVPHEGHFNSQYWRLKRPDDGLDLYCCPNGCSVAEAESKMARYLACDKTVMQEGHDSFGWKPILSLVENCWIAPDGTLYPVLVLGHAAFAVNVSSQIGIDPERDLECQGWVKISSGSDVMLTGDIPPNSRQKDTIFDYSIAKGYDTRQIFDKASIRGLILG